MYAVSVRHWAPSVVLLVSFVASDARADDSDEAQGLLAEAVDARSRDDLAEARRLLARSLQLVPAAPVAFNLADVLSRMGRACEASELYESLLEGTFGDLGTRRRQVRRRHAESMAQTTELRVVLEGAPTARLIVDSNEPNVLRRGLGLALCVDQGEHNVFVSEEGFHRFEERLTAVPGEAVRLLVTLTPVEALADDSQPQSSTRRRPWLWAVLGVVVVGAVATGVAFAATRESDAFSDPVWGNKQALHF